MWGQPFPVAGALDDGPVVSVGQLSMARLPRMGSSKSSDNSYTALLLAMTKLDARCRLLTNEANRIKPVTTHASWQTTPREQGQLRAAGPLSNPRGAIEPSYATPEPTVCGRKPCPDPPPRHKAHAEREALRASRTIETPGTDPGGRDGQEHASWALRIARSRFTL